MDDMRLLSGVCGSELAVGTAALAAAGGPIGAVVVFGGLAICGICIAIFG